MQILALVQIFSMSALYAVEKQAAELSVAERLHLRQTWAALNAFCSDGRCPYNKISERGMKRVVLNPKHSLFVGSPRGGLANTCRRHDVDPQLYLTQC
jgi:hypothetical protein